MDLSGQKAAQPCDAPTSSSAMALPNAPNPHADPGIIPKQIGLPAASDAAIAFDPSLDVTKLDPLQALSLLSTAVQALADLTGDVPPTPPISRPGTPSTSSIRQQLGHRRAISKPANAPSNVPLDDVVSALRNAKLGSPEAHVLEPDGISEVIQDVTPKVQFDTIARKFFSKKPPPISIDDYLQRMHRYCPMSTAVYLAAGVYLYRLAIEDKSVPVTGRTIHRLLLGTLRIAMKALEDLSYPHKRFAGVGGVSERELAKLEISVCFLLDFELRVTVEVLQEKMLALHQLACAGKTFASAGSIQLNMPNRTKTSRRQTVT